MKNYKNSTGWMEIYFDLQNITKILFEIENLMIDTNIFNIFKKKNYDDCEVRLKDCLVELQKYDVIEGPTNANIDKLKYLKYRFKVDLKIGIKKTIDSFKNN